MPITFKCGQCQQPYQVPDQAAGKQVKCKKCGAAMTVPGGMAPPAAHSLDPLGGGGFAAQPSPFGGQANPMLPGGGMPQGFPGAPQPDMQWGQPQFGAQFGSPPPAKRKGMSRGAKLGLMVGGGAVGTLIAIGLIVFLILKLVGGGGTATTAATGGASDPAAAAGATAPSAASGWRSIVDPPRDLPKIPHTMKSIPAVSTSFEGQFPADVLFAPGASPFVLIGGLFVSSDGFKIFDLRTQTMTAEVKDGEVFKKARFSGPTTGGSNIALSFDGQYIVGASLITNPEVREGHQAAAVLSTKTGDFAKLFHFENPPKVKEGVDPGSTHVVFTGFVGDDKVLAITRVLGGPNPQAELTEPARAHVFNFQTGDELNKFDVSSMSLTLGGAPVISPGGKYLAIFSPAEIQFYEILTGKVATVLKPPAGKDVRMFMALHSNGFAFSVDGAEFSFFSNLGEGFTKRITTWNMKDGSIVSDISFTREQSDKLKLERYNDKHFLCSPDGGGWLLYGMYFVDRQTQRVIGPFATVKDVPAEGDVHIEAWPRKLIDSKHCIVSAGTKKTYRLEVFEIPAE